MADPVADVHRIMAIIAYTDGSSSNYTSANDGQVVQISQTDFAVVEAELFSFPSFRDFMASIGISLGAAIDITHISDIVWSVTMTDETGTRVITSFDAVGGFGTNSNATYDPNTFPNFNQDNVPDQAATATATMKAVAALAVVAGGSGYVVGNDITLAGGTSSVAAIIRVSTLGTIAGQDETDYSVTEANGTFAGGTGYTVNDVNTMSDGSTITVDAVAAGVVTQFTITTASTSGLASSATITQTSSTGEGATGFAMTLDVNNQAVFAATILTAGSYSIIPSNPVSQSSATGSGTGATFTMDWGVNTVTVTGGGQGYESVPVVSFSGGTGSAATATLTDDVVTSIAVTTAGSGHTVTTTVTVASPT